MHLSGYPLSLITTQVGSLSAAVASWAETLWEWQFHCFDYSSSSFGDSYYCGLTVATIERQIHLLRDCLTTASITSATNWIIVRIVEADAKNCKSRRSWVGRSKCKLKGADLGSGSTTVLACLNSWSSQCFWQLLSSHSDYHSAEMTSCSNFALE